MIDRGLDEREIDRPSPISAPCASTQTATARGCCTAGCDRRGCTRRRPAPTPTPARPGGCAPLRASPATRGPAAAHRRPARRAGPPAVERARNRAEIGIATLAHRCAGGAEKDARFLGQLRRAAEQPAQGRREDDRGACRHELQQRQQRHHTRLPGRRSGSVASKSIHVTTATASDPASTVVHSASTASASLSGSFMDLRAEHRFTRVTSSFVEKGLVM